MAPVTPPALVAHILPSDLGRGAQTYAAALRDRLEGRPHHHVAVALFDGEAGTLRPEVALNTPAGWGRRAGFDPRALLRLRAWVGRTRPDLLVAHGGEALKYAALVRRGPAPLAYYKVGTVTAGARRGIRRAFYRRLAARTDLVVGVSQEAADEARQVLGVPAARLAVVPNGRDPAPFLPRPPHEGPARLLFLGRMTTGKRPAAFVRLVESLRREGVPVEAAMAGDGPELARLRPEADAAGIAVLGHLDDVPAAFAQADVFVFPSAPEGEGMPGVLIEAGLAGLATVTTDVPGASTVVEDGRTGFVVGVDDDRGLLDAVRTLATDTGLRQDMGRSARARCMADFTLEASVEAWARLIDQLLA